MTESKMVKAVCKKTGLCYGLEVKEFNGEWRVVNAVRLTDDEADVITTDVKQSFFNTNDNLIACGNCGSRRIGGCKCPRKSHKCSKKMEYEFDCIYCDQMEIDYSRARGKSSGRNSGEITLEQGQKVKITFSNVEWKKYDRIPVHPSGAVFSEPSVHIIANEERIEFHGYNVSAMDEGVYYKIDPNDDFEISCDVNTSTIRPHPGGHLLISMGIITAELSEKGGMFYLDGQNVAKVGSQFSMKLSLNEGGRYTITINGRVVGNKYQLNRQSVDIIFGFRHQSHYCAMLSHAYISDIQMAQTKGGAAGQ